MNIVQFCCNAIAKTWIKCEILWCFSIKHWFKIHGQIHPYFVLSNVFDKPVLAYSQLVNYGLFPLALICLGSIDPKWKRNYISRATVSSHLARSKIEMICFLYTNCMALNQTWQQHTHIQNEEKIAGWVAIIHYSNLYSAVQILLCISFISNRNIYWFSDIHGQ